jgi:transposase, IS5 family
MEALVPWQPLIEALSPSYFLNAACKRGRPPIGLEAHAADLLILKQ